MYHYYLNGTRRAIPISRSRASPNIGLQSTSTNVATFGRIRGVMAVSSPHRSRNGTNHHNRRSDDGVLRDVCPNHHHHSILVAGVPWRNDNDPSSKCSSVRTIHSNSNGDKNIQITSVSNPVEQLDKLSNRLLEAQVGSLNSASLHEIKVAISSWHNQISSFNSDKRTFKSGEHKYFYSAERAHRLLHRLLQECRHRTDDTGSDSNVSVENDGYRQGRAELTTESLNQVLDCWRITNSACLEYRNNRLDVGASIVVPTADGGSVDSSRIELESNDMDTLGQYTHENIAQKACDILKQIQQYCITTPTVTIDHPNLKSYNMLMNIYSKRGDVVQAQSLFDTLQHQIAPDHPECRPDVITYNSLISTYANVPPSAINQPQNYSLENENSMNKADEILQQMLHLYQTTNDPDIQPNVVTYTSVLASYANPYSHPHNNVLAPVRSRALLKQMMELYTSDPVLWSQLEPNVVFYSALMNVWSQMDGGGDVSGGNLNTAIDSALGLLGVMEQFKTGHDIDDGNETEEMSKNPSLDTTDLLLEQMMQLVHEQTSSSSSTNVNDMTSMMSNTIAPNTITFTTLINCLAQSISSDRLIKGSRKGRQAATKAESIVARMEHAHREDGNINVRPTVITYNALINVWAKSMEADAGIKAEEILNRMESIAGMSDSDHEEAFHDVTVKPDTVTYAAVIDAYANSGGVCNVMEGNKKLDDNGKNAERILMKMVSEYERGEDDHVVPNALAFTSAINAYANCGQPVQAEKLLRLMHDLYMTGRKGERLESVKPNSYSFSAVINAYAKSNKRDSAQKAQEVLETMEDMGLANNVGYTSVIDAWSKSGVRGADSRAEELLDRMIALYNEGNTSLKPNTVTYNAVMNTYAKSKDEGVADKALALLNEMEEQYETTKDPDIKPNTVSFNTCLSALSNSTKRGTVEKAEGILQRMQNFSDLGHSDVQPDTFSLTSVISVWAKSTEKNAAQRAEDILHHMQSLYESGNINMKPTTVAFGAVLHAWARKGNAERAQAIVDRMEQLFENGNEEARPNTIIYNTLINAWAKSGKGGAEKAEQILKRMQNLSDSGFLGVKPVRITFNSVISSYAKSTAIDALEKAQDLVEKMENLQYQDPSVAPDVVTYTSLINVIVNSKDINKAEKAQNVLQKMEELHKSGVRNVQPNNFTFDAVLRACAFSRSSNNHGEEIKRKNLVIAIKTLTKIQESSHVNPTSYTYDIFFLALSKLSVGKEYHKLLEHSIRMCLDDGLLNDSIITNLSKTAPSELLQQCFKTQITPSKLRVRDLPPKWSSSCRKDLSVMSAHRQTERSKHQTGRRRIKR